MYEEEFMLTTYDNLFNPFDDFERWWKEDLRLGHDCCGYLAEVSAANKIASESVNRQRTLEAMNKIVSSEPLIYRKVTRNDFKST